MAAGVLAYETPPEHTAPSYAAPVTATQSENDDDGGTTATATYLLAAAAVAGATVSRVIGAPARAVPSLH